MSVSYRIKVDLKVQFNEETVKKILGRGAEGMLIFYKDIEGLDNPITPKEAAFLIASGWENYLGLRYIILCSFKGTFFDLSFYPNDHLRFGLIPALSIWEKDFIHDDFGIDIASYLEIVLMVSRDFKITKMEYYTY